MVSQARRISGGPGTSRPAILQSATEVFVEMGFSGARVDEIARRARANKAMIYYHFGSKRGLYKAVLLALFGSAFDEVERLRASTAGPEEKLRALYTKVATQFGENRALPHIMMREILAGGKNMDAEASRTLGSIVSFVSETIGEGVRLGVFERVHPLLLHLTILGPLLLHFTGAPFRDRVLPQAAPHLAAPTHEDMLTHLLEVLDRALAPKKTERPRRAPAQRKTK